MKFLNLFLLILTFSLVNCQELYTSIYGLEAMVETETKLVEFLNNYLDFSYERLKIMQDAQTRWKIIGERLNQRYEDNLIDNFLFLKTYTEPFNTLKCAKAKGDSMYWDFLKFKNTLFQPKADDLTGAGTALLRLRDTYKIPVKELSSRMTTDETFLIGHIAVLNKQFYQAIPWLQEVEFRLKGGQVASRVKLVTLYEYLAYAMREQWNFEWAFWYTRKLQDIGDSRYPVEEWIEFYLKRLKLLNSTWDGKFESLPAVNLKRPLSFDSFPEFEALCRGEKQNMAHEFVKSPMNCYFKRNTDFLKLAPIKVEMLSQDPDIYRFPHSITDKEISHLIGLAAPKLKRAKVMNDKWRYNVNETAKEIDSSYRTAKHMAVHDRQDEVVGRLSKRVADMTDLSLESAEELQIQNYGLGGHYSPHYDMATLSDVEAGGATVFDEADVASFPKKNDAVFWYNLHKSGKPDFMTHHGGCPVLIGSKWVANKWLHERGQEFRRPCSLNENE